MRPDLIVDYLSRFSVAIVHYLQYLIFSKKLQVSNELHKYFFWKRVSQVSVFLSWILKSRKFKKTLLKCFWRKLFEQFIFCLFQKEKYHTHLAVLYLDRVLQLLKDSNTTKQQLDQARSVLDNILSTLKCIGLVSVVLWSLTKVVVLKEEF